MSESLSIKRVQFERDGPRDSAQFARRMGEPGVNLAGLRQKICLGDGLASLILAEFGQEPLNSCT